jgi:hypothetical protein
MMWWWFRYCRIKRRGGQPPGRTVLFLQSLYFRGIPTEMKNSVSGVYFTIEQKDPTNRDKKHLYSSKGQLTPIAHKKHNTIQFDSSKKLITLNEDVLFTFYHGMCVSLMGCMSYACAHVSDGVYLLCAGGAVSTAKMFQFWINTRFCELTNTGNVVLREEDPLPHGLPGTNPMMSLKKKEIDKADKDKKHKKYPADFRIELVFGESPHLHSSLWFPFLFTAHLILSSGDG